MINLIVAMDHVFMVHGHVMVIQTARMALMKLTVLLYHVLTLIVVSGLQLIHVKL